MVLEDFTTYTEVEPFDRIQKTANHIDAVLYRNEDTYLYKDKGVNHFEDFEHKVDVKIVSANNASWCHCYLGLSNVLDDAFQWGADKIAIRLSGATVPLYRINLYTSGGSDYYTCSVGTWYYLLLKREGTDVTLKIYDTAESRDAETADEHLLDTLTQTCGADEKYRYVYGCASSNESINTGLTVDIENLDLQEITAKFKTVTEILGLTDTKSRSKDIHRITTELLGLVDTISYHPRSHYKTITEQLGLVDTKSWIHGRYKTITEILGLVDTKTRTKTIHRTITELLRLEDIAYSDKTVYIILNGVAYCCILDVDFVEINRVALPEWINYDAAPDVDVDTNVWNLKPLKIVYTFRVTHLEKWNLDQILIGHSSVKLSDGMYGIIGQDVFMINLEAIWEGDINYAKPWLITIELIPC